MYRHYKGDHYKVEGFAIHHETRQDMVLYRSGAKGWLNARPVQGTATDPDGWCDPVRDEHGNERARFELLPPSPVLLLEDVGYWIAMCQADANMRAISRPTLKEVQRAVRRRWTNPLPLRFPKDFPLMDHEFEHMMSHGKLYSTDDWFTWYVLDVEARKRSLTAHFEQRFTNAQGSYVLDKPLAWFGDDDTRPDSPPAARTKSAQRRPISPFPAKGKERYKRK